MNLKKFVLFCISLVIFSSPQSGSQACGWFDEGEYYYKFFSPEIFGQKDLMPFNFTFDLFYEGEWNNGEDDNLKEWKAYLRNFPSEQELNEVVYHFSSLDLEHIEQYIGGTRKELNENVKKNAVVRLWLQNSDRDMLTYLKYAKWCQNYVWTDSEWDTPEIPDEDRTNLTEQMEAEMKRTQSAFLQLRYAFQIVRLAHYSGHYKDAIRLYDQYVVPNKTEGLIKAWAMALKAGALRRTGQEAQSAYMFAQVFDGCSSKRPQAYLSWGISSDENWEKALSYCKNDQEKAALYVMRAINPSSVSLEDVEMVYKLNPSSEMLDLLIVREINKLEQDFFGFGFHDNLPVNTGYFGFPESKEEDRVGQLLGFIEQGIKQKKVHDPELWAIAGGYLQFLNGNYDNATATLRALFKQAGMNPEESAGAKRLMFVVNVARTEKADKESENRLWAEYKELEKVMEEPDAVRALEFMEDIFARLYRKQGQPAKYILAAKLERQALMEPSHPLLIDLQSWVKSTGKSEYEKFLMTRFDESLGWETLIEKRGTLYLGTGDFDKAIAEFEKLPAASLPVISSNPFVYQTVQYINCYDQPDNICRANKYNKLELARVLKTLESEAKTNPSKAGQNYFMLATAYYNMSYYGFSWKILAEWRPSGSWTEKQDPAPLYPTSSWSVLDRTDISMAQKYFALAMDSASDRELKAMACFGLAKCEQVEYYQSSDFDNYMQPWAMGADKYFRVLNTEYSNTEYFQQAINECWYFDRYVDNH